MTCSPKPSAATALRRLARDIDRLGFHAAQDRADAPCTRCGATPETGLRDGCPECQGIVGPDFEEAPADYPLAIEEGAR